MKRHGIIIKHIHILADNSPEHSYKGVVEESKRYGFQIVPHPFHKRAHV